MLVIKTAEAIEKIFVIGEVSEHPDVPDIKPWDWSTKPIRPNKIKAEFVRTNGTEWTLSGLTVYGFDVLKSGKPSDNPNCWREHEISRDGRTHPLTSSFDHEQIELTAWARDWAMIELARINEVTERPDLDSDVVLYATDLDAPQPRRFPLDSPEPRENGLRVRSTVNDVIFRYNANWGRWVAEQDSGGDGNNYSWNALNSSNSEYATDELVEVL